nr:SIS domain-containing protein [uncultured Bacteroides sp.]
MESLIYESLSESQNVLDEFIKSDAAELINKAATIMTRTFQNGGKVISCGNGGSLCDAAHFAEELTGRYRKNRRPYAAIAINDPAYITCVGNDFSFDEIFSRYIEAMGKQGDTLLAISTSGNSENVIRAVKTAKSIGMNVISLTRVGENRLLELSDIALVSPATDFSDRIQEIHIKIIHILIQAIEAKLGHN